MYVATSTILGEDMAVTNAPNIATRKGSVTVSRKGTVRVTTPPVVSRKGTVADREARRLAEQQDEEAQSLLEAQEAEAARQARLLAEQQGNADVVEKETNWKKYLLWGGVAAVVLVSGYYMMKGR